MAAIFMKRGRSQSNPFEHGNFPQELSLASYT